MLTQNIYKRNTPKSFMGTVAVKMKIMPSSPEADLEQIKEEAKKILEDEEFHGTNFSEEPIAFGLKAVIVSFGGSEDKEMESLQKKLEEIENVNSVNVLDMRRAL